MGDFSIYIIKVAVLLALLFSVYKLTAGRLKCARLQRAMLLAIYPVSLLTPLIKPEWFQYKAHEPIQNIDWSTLTVISGNEIVVSSDSNIFADIAVVLMIGGSIIAAVISLTGLLWIAKCRLSGKSLTIGSLPVTVVSTPEISPFSFGGRIYLSSTDFEAQNEMIIAHESSHIRHRHYLDLLIGRCVAITQWWNPLAWLMLQEIHNVHEFQADSDVIAQGFDLKEYQYLLLRETVGPRFQNMTDSFNHSKLKGRLLMINRKDSGFSVRFLSLLCIPAIIAGIMMISSDTFADFTHPLANAFESDQNQNEVSSEIDNLPQIHIDKTGSEMINEEETGNQIPTITELATDPEIVRHTSNSETIVVTDVSSEPEGKQPIRIESNPTEEETEYELSDRNIKVVSVGTIKKDDSTIPSIDESNSGNTTAIRGVNNMSQDSPDFLVNGVPCDYKDIKKIDPSTIKDISILKNSEKHPNGLIVINLKEPKDSSADSK